MKRWPAVVLLLSLALAARAQVASDVRIYRCTDAAGRQTLRDTPCPKGQAQQVRAMLRPKDAPRVPRAAPAKVVAAPSAPPAPAPVVYLAPPRPMYECVTDEGKRYTSENGEGNPRWVPFWTLGYPQYGRVGRNGADRGTFRSAPSESAAIGRPQQPLPSSTGSASARHPVPWPVASGGGTWIRDDCAMLPPRETCARLRDRRDAIRSRFFNAMPSERDVLRVEERTIDARLDDDCGGR
jgi:hypothetical protein